MKVSLKDNVNYSANPKSNFSDYWNPIVSVNIYMDDQPKVTWLWFLFEIKIERQNRRESHESRNGARDYVRIHTNEVSLWTDSNVGECSAKWSAQNL